jgi:peptidoglycan/xylan/chitin deacetylase (PgdA/CDA1 family)
MALDPIDRPRVGLLQVIESLLFNDRDVALTIDRGPRSPDTDRILDAQSGEGSTSCM